ncbi:lipocalin family protein [Corynebacterium freiburgense]|uniref:lipocalin family protein n=1 Tax=Corynebacterium freiburgense TaxID=556548 RepID=UPI0004099E9E|nr:lipocalin family protein [Corynebacterium freiburgense]WJZ03677.1 Outer membrane lipoprotein Blc precursor [Corynebacterium freiburgense]
MRFVSSIFSVVCLGILFATPAQAEDIFNGGRFAGGSSDLVQPLSSTGPELPEFGRTVDLDKYAGTWYQVAAIPQPYTLMCTHDTKAQYEKVDDTTISVVNSCGTPLEPSRIDGQATVRSQATLRVDFNGIPFQPQNKPDNYRVTHLAEDYSLSIVGSPNRNAGFVLSRTPSLSPEQWREVRGIVEQRGWWPCAFLTTPMAGGRGDVTPLCAIN